MKHRCSANATTTIYLLKIQTFLPNTRFLIIFFLNPKICVKTTVAYFFPHSLLPLAVVHFLLRPIIMLDLKSIDHVALYVTTSQV